MIYLALIQVIPAKPNSQAITWNSDDPVHWRMHASPGISELTNERLWAMGPDDWRLAVCDAMTHAGRSEGFGTDGDWRMNHTSWCK